MSLLNGLEVTFTCAAHGDWTGLWNQSGIPFAVLGFYLYPGGGFGVPICNGYASPLMVGGSGPPGSGEVVDPAGFTILLRVNSGGNYGWSVNGGAFHASTNSNQWPPNADRCAVGIGAPGAINPADPATLDVAVASSVTGWSNDFDDVLVSDTWRLRTAGAAVTWATSGPLGLAGLTATDGAIDRTVLSGIGAVRPPGPVRVLRAPDGGQLAMARDNAGISAGADLSPMTLRTALYRRASQTAAWELRSTYPATGQGSAANWGIAIRRGQLIRLPSTASYASTDWGLTWGVPDWAPQFHYYDVDIGDDGLTIYPLVTAAGLRYGYRRQDGRWETGLFSDGRQQTFLAGPTHTPLVAELDEAMSAATPCSVSWAQSASGQQAAAVFDLDTGAILVTQRAGPGAVWANWAEAVPAGYDIHWPAIMARDDGQWQLDLWVNNGWLAYTAPKPDGTWSLVT